MKILVLRGGALGDFIVTLPMLVALRRHWPKAVVTLVGNSAAAAIALHRGIVDEVVSQHEARFAGLYASSPLTASFERWLYGFDVIISFWPDPDGTLSRHLGSLAATRCVIAAAMPAVAPAAAHYCSAVRGLGADAGEVFVRISALDDGADDPPPPVNSRRPIAIHPGSGSPRKNWPVDRWLELIDAIPDPVQLFVGEAEAEPWTEAALRSAGLGDRLRDGSLALAAALPLEELIRRLAGCRLFAGHDSGISHLAAAVGLRCILLFGPTDPAMWAPAAPGVRVIRRGDDLSAISVADVLSAMATVREA